MSKFTVESSNSALFKPGESYTLEELNQKLQGQSLGSSSGQESITFTYTADIKDGYESGALQSTPGEEYKNTATLHYTNNKKETKTESASAMVASSQPSIDKSDGVLSGDGKTLTWTITIKLNGTKWEDITSITDIPGAGLENAGVAQNLDKNLFTETPPGSGIYTYTYTTTITEAYLNSTGQNTISNKAQIQTKNGGEFSDTGFYSLQGKDWISKEFVECIQDGEGNTLLNWKVTLNIPADVKNIVLTDWVDESGDKGKHELTGDLYLSVDGDKRLAVSGISKDNYHGLGGTVVDEDRVLRVDWEGLHLQDSLAGKTVEIYYTTKVTDSSLSGHKFKNYAQVKYQDAVGEKTSPEVSAEWESKSAISKTGVPVEGANAIRYTLKLDLTKLDLPEESGLRPGDEIVLVDKLPEGLVLDETAGVQLKTMYVDGTREEALNLWAVQQAGATALPDAAVGYTLQESGREIVFRIPVDANILKIAKLQEVRDFSTCVPHLFVEYTLKVSDEAAFVRERKFVNQASGTFRGSSIGEAQAATTLVPQPVVSKTAKYDETTAPYAEYTVEINPGALDLSSGDWLDGKDVLGSALSYDLTSIKVVEVKKDGSEQELTKGADYQYAYSLKENSLTFKLPDGKHLRITYRAAVSLHYSAGGNNEKLNEENSGNTFSISGHSADALESKSRIGTAIIRPSAWAVGDTASIQIYKYHDERGSMEPLSGARFHIEEVQESGSGFIVKEGGSSWDAVTGGDGMVSVPGSSPVKLVRGQIYKLTETQAPAGYARSEEAVYFVIPDEDTDTEAMEAMGVKAYASAATIFFQNFPSASDSAKLVLEKTVTGIQEKGVLVSPQEAWERVRDTLTFEIKDGADTITVKGSDAGWSYDAASGSYKKTLSLDAGMYTVMESCRDVAGYTLESVSYTVEAGSSSVSRTGQTASNIQIEASGSASVSFTNTYKRDTGSLKLTKTVIGLRAEELQAAIAGGKLRFVVKNVETGIEYTRTLAAFSEQGGKYICELKDLPTGTYTITESDYDITNYQAGITYAVTGGSSGTGLQARVEITKDNETQAEFTDTYTSTQGSLVIQKQVSRKDPNSEVIGWNQVKDTISFTITDESGRTVRTISPSSDIFTDNDGDGVYSYTVTGLDAGKTYTVTETAGKPEGCIGYVTTYTVTDVSGSGGGSGQTARAQISSTQGAVVTFTNTYEREPKKQPNTSQPSPSPQPSQPPAAPSPSPASTPKAAPPIQLQVSPLPSPAPLKEGGTVLSAGRDKVPQTGDYFYLWVVLFCLSLGSLMGYLCLLNRKNRRSGEQPH